MPSILVIGSSNTDMVVKVDRFPNPGETLLGGEFFMFPGGKGANQAVAAARLGGTVTFLCRVGDDVFGKKALDGFRAEGIDTRLASTDPKLASGVALITVSHQGENEIVVASGANAALSISDLERSGSALRDADIVLTQLEIPLSVVEYTCRECRRLNKSAVLNPAPGQKLTNEILRDLFLITPNETEAEVLTGITLKSDNDLPRVAEALMKSGVSTVVITLGAKGAYFQSEQEQFQISAPSVRAVDTTAAGDVFNGALAVAIAERKDWRSAINFAVKAASLSVTRMGAQSSAPYLRELDP